MVSNYADGKTRRLDSYPTESDALAAAEKLARRLDSRDYVAASLTREEAMSFANAQARLAPYGVTVDAATAAVAQCLEKVGDLGAIVAAVQQTRQWRRVEAKPVAAVVAELIAVKAGRGVSKCYIADLRQRLGRFASAFACDFSSVTGPLAQAWLDGLKLGPQTYENYRRCLSLLGGFAVSRGYAHENIAEGLERVKIRPGDVSIFTAAELVRLFQAARPEFIPSLAVQAFAGIRTAELQRLVWPDVSLSERIIIVAATKSKTGARRVIPLTENLRAWLTPFATATGKLWQGADSTIQKHMNATARRAGVRWKRNGLRHTFASAAFALTADAGRVAGFCGNSPAVIHRYYRRLMRPAEALQWFSVYPEGSAPSGPPVLEYHHPERILS